MSFDIKHQLNSNVYSLSDIVSVRNCMFLESLFDRDMFINHSHVVMATKKSISEVKEILFSMFECYLNGQSEVIVKFKSNLFCSLNWAVSIYTILSFDVFSDDKDKIKETQQMLRPLFDDDISSCPIRRYFVTKGEVHFKIPIEFLNESLLPESYPYISDIGDYIKDYLDSDESALILIGPPGTGKTRLLRYVVQKAIESNFTTGVFYTNDSSVLDHDIMFSDFLESDFRVMVLEDMDLSLGKRTNGNTQMYRLLATADGFIQSRGRKIIISTNISDRNEIDPALIRDGRCFDILNTRKLKNDEVLKLLEELNPEIGLNNLNKNEYTLAELYKISKNRRLNKNVKSVGF